MGLLYEAENYTVLGACFEVYKEQGCGFLEDVYQESLEIELGLRGVPFLAKPKLELAYKGKKLRQWYAPDLLCFGKIIVEVKAVKCLCNEHRAQLHNYLVTTGYRVGYLANFSLYPKLEYERIVR
jgi:GxxExxY protein